MMKAMILFANKTKQYKTINIKLKRRVKISVIIVHYLEMRESTALRLRLLNVSTRGEEGREKLGRRTRI